MAADWSRLERALRDLSGDSVTFTWAELDQMVGGMPASAVDHVAWWSGDRPHTRAWKRAGFRVDLPDPGVRVRFAREGAAVSQPNRTTPAAAEWNPEAATSMSASSDLLLVTCVKTKASTPQPAKDLYVSPTFRKSRAYAEASGRPWFILSAEHGLVQPDEWLAPYERYLPDTPPAYRRVWGAWVIARLALLTGPLWGRTVEIHASNEYVEALRSSLEAEGARVVEPLQGLTQGQRSQWYDRQAAAPGQPTAAPSEDVAIDALAEALLDESRALRPEEVLARGRAGIDVPGLYSWWIDETGAHELSEVLEVPLEAGLLYAGLAGATRWPSGRRSSNTLWLRIVTMHLGGRHEFSTFRRSLGALRTALTDSPVDEDELTRWMHEHLRVVLVPFTDADRLGEVESQVLDGLDPPLNLKGVAATALRMRLKQLRRELQQR